MAHLVKRQVGFQGGKEGKLSTIGSMLLWFGLIVAGVTVIVGFVSKNADTTTCVVAGFVVALNAIVANAILQGFAELIRLFKQQNGMSYGGMIESVNPIHEYVCSKCGKNQNLDHVRDKTCWNCNEGFGVENPE